MNHIIGKKIALLRKEKHISQTELAQYLYLTPQTVSRWEMGKGPPEISLLPKIASFFNVSIDELFGLTSISRADDLVLKYSVLRDDRSFLEAMDCLNSQIQTIDAALDNKTALKRAAPCHIEAETTSSLQKDRDRLEALKVHLLLQQGRESFERALNITDSFVKKTENSPEAPWYLPMRLQRLQLRAALGEGRSVLAECRQAFAGNPNVTTLQLYFEILLILQDYEKILSMQEKDMHARDILFPPSESNLILWKQLMKAAEETGNSEFVEMYNETIRKQESSRSAWSHTVS